MLEQNSEKQLKVMHLPLYYQPLININTHKVIGYEALLRWIDLDGKVIYPDSFIFVAEQTGLIIDIGKLILEKCIFTSTHMEKYEYRL